MTSIRYVLLMLLLLSFSPAQSADITYFVTSLGDFSDSEINGTCAGGPDGACSLRAAIEEANNRSASHTIEIQFRVAGQVELERDLSEGLDIAANVTVIGHADGTVIAGDNQLGVFDIKAGGIEPYNVTLQNLAINGGGNFEGGAIINRGNLVLDSVLIANGSITRSAILNQDASLRISNSLFQNNARDLRIFGGSVEIDSSEFAGGELRLTTIGGGGAILVETGTLVVNNTTFDGNSSDGAGGAIHVLYGSAFIADSVFSNNDGDNGGAIYSEGSLVVSGNVLFDGNRATYGHGGAVHVANGYASISNAEMKSNAALLPALKPGVVCGGAVYLATAGTLHISNSNIYDNSSNTRGAGVCFNARTDTGNASIRDSRISSNRVQVSAWVENPVDADYLGGGVLMGGGVSIERTLITKNIAQFGGGIFAEGSGNLLQNLTMKDNTAISGAAVYYNSTGNSLPLKFSTLDTNEAEVTTGANQLFVGSGSLELTGVLIAPGEGGTANCIGTIDSQGYNIDSDNSCGLDQATDQVSVTDPGLDSLRDNGGLFDSIALLGASNPALAQVAQAECPGLDQRGFARGAGDCDVGSFEAGGVAQNSGEFNFSVATVIASESQASIDLRVSRSGGSDGAAVIRIVDLMGGTATGGGSDYELPENALISWADGETGDKTVAVSIFNDTVKEAENYENAFFALAVESGVGQPGSLSVTELQIFEGTDDLLSSGEFKLSSEFYSTPEKIRDDTQDTVSEGQEAQETTVAIEIQRLKGSTGEVTLAYETSDITAEAGDDYVAASGHVTFEDGETSKTIEIIIIDDVLVEDSETFLFELSKINANDPVIFSEPTQATVTINSDDVLPAAIETPVIDRTRPATGAVGPMVLLAIFLGCACRNRRQV